MTEQFLAHIKLQREDIISAHSTPLLAFAALHVLSIHHSSPPHLFSPPSRVRRAVSQVGGAMAVYGATVSISDGTTITSCSAVAGGDYAVRARRPQQRVSLRRGVGAWQHGGGSALRVRVACGAGMYMGLVHHAGGAGTWRGATAWLHGNAAAW